MTIDEIGLKQITQDGGLIYNVLINTSKKSWSSFKRLENKICFELICTVLNKNLDSLKLKI